MAQGEMTTKLKAPRMLAVPPAILTIILDANGSITPYTIWEESVKKIDNGSLYNDNWELVLDFCQMA